MGGVACALRVSRGYAPWCRTMYALCMHYVCTMYALCMHPGASRQRPTGGLEGGGAEQVEVEEGLAAHL